MTGSIKIAFWIAVLALAVLRPKLGDEAWQRVEEAGRRVARRPVAGWLGLGLLVLLVRAALLPLWAIPEPVIYDEFGYLLQADTFASGRLTNPPHAVLQFFESVYILHQPTYNAKYPPGQGLALALGQAVLGDPWFGVWLSCGAMMAALCWALQGWLPQRWALLGGLLALPLCLFSYWMDSYWGGAVAAVGGALVMGAYARILRGRSAYAWLLGLGLVLLAMTRMYEGALFSAPFAAAVVVRTRRLRVWAPIALVLVAGASFLLHYNAVVTGHALRLPYAEYQRQYGYVPLFHFQALSPAKIYHNQSVADVFFGWEYRQWKRSQTWTLWLDRGQAWGRVLALLAQVWPLMLLFAALVWTAFRDRRMRLPLFGLGAVCAGSLLQITYYAHYAAPAMAALLLVLVQCLRHLRQIGIRGTGVGRSLGRAVPAGMLLLVCFDQGARLYRQEAIEQTQPANARRGRMERKLVEERPDRKHLIVVRYTGTQDPHEEWVYNRADIDGSSVVWAHDLGAEQNRVLLDYFQERTVWLFQPDRDPDLLTPY